jgi:site-specific DNA-methyltransferase (adenine-specific)
VTPYYQDDAVTIYHGDCREILPTLPKHDLLLTDPPYGLGDKWNGGGGSLKSSWAFDPSEAKQWDMEISDGIPIAIEHADNSIVWGGNYYLLPPSRCWLIWDKKQPDTWTTGQAEMAWTTLDRPVRVFRLAQCEAHGQMGKKEHPTQKPVSLIRWCMKWSDATTILDPFAGSGTTGVAAKLEGRKATLIELEERYCEIGANRLSQGVLF